MIVNKKNIQIMLIQILIMVFLGGCLDEPPDEKQVLQEVIDTSNTQQIDYQELNLVDSTRLITQLYKGKKIIPSKEYSDFSYSVSFDKKTKLITIESSNTIAGYKIDYFVLLIDTAGIYSKEEFSAFDDGYKYDKSYFKVDGRKVEISETGLINLPQKKIKPSLLWYDKGFGISGKYYKVGAEEFFLLRGLDLYCNGRQCTSYQVFVLQKNKEEIKSDVFYFEGLYPYDFENTFLFDDDNDGYPEIFVPKDVDELREIGDFEKFELETAVATSGD